MKDAIRRVLSKPSVWIMIIYMIVPVDLIEDSIPVAGMLDDIIVAFACLIASEMLNNTPTK
jgi:uncharacterized membrane protein YkvA (DUF1232 family)